MKPIGVSDETGQGWLVWEGDPVWSHVHQLSLLGAAYVVLPRDLIVNGSLELTDYSNSVTLSGLDVSKPAIATLARRLIRLQDCLYVLRGGHHRTPGLHPIDTAGKEPTLAAD